MPSTADHTAPTTPNAQPRRRLISRITSPFASKPRNFAEFSIKIRDPHKQYSPGETVYGHVDLRVAKPTRITHLTVSLHGYVQVYKNPGCPPSDAYRANNAQVGSGAGSKSGEYFGNGFATLFEDESVLCGDGKLNEGGYKFEFELEFPDRDLPSSIAFERGTVSYLVTATLTRPNAIVPITQCEHKISFLERIDISQLISPKARTITLEPISRRARAKTHARKLVEGSEERGRNHDSNERSSICKASETSSQRSVRADGETPGSPSPSEVSFDSSVYGPVSHENNGISPRQSDASRTNGSKVSLPPKSITATVESLTGGCLRGDGVPIRVIINHTKFVKSLYGVIITLYRSARVDMHPAIPLGPTEKGKEGKYEDYYPKSVTGLGGLSLSGAGSSHNFRKDLSQVMLPLVVDPATLTAEVNGRVHVPDEAFPTISTVPGAMISFRYYVEVVIDIQGKLSTQDRNLNNFGGLTSTLNQPVGDDGATRERSAFNQYSSPMIDTATLRREKGLVAATFEVIVGTKDSERRKGKRRAEPQAEGDETLQSPAQPSYTVAQREAAAPRQAAANNAPSDQPWRDYSEEHGYSYGPGYEEYGYAYGYDPRWDHNQHTSWQEPGHYDDVTQAGFMYQDPGYLESPVPMPPVDDESQLTEKEQMQRAEARLLPSQPPGVPEQHASGQPTAPYLPEEHANGSYARSTPPGHSYPAASAAPIDPSSRTAMPMYQPGSSSEATILASDDKSELQRRDAQQMASSSPPAASQEAHYFEPTAPILHDDDDLYNVPDDDHADARASTSLPRYER